MNLAEGAKAPSPGMMMRKPPMSATQPPQRRLLELAEQLAQRAAAPSSQFLEQIPAASPAPFFAPAPTAGITSLEELQRRDAATKPEIAGSVYDGEKKKNKKSESFFQFFF